MNDQGPTLALPVGKGEAGAVGGLSHTEGTETQSLAGAVGEHSKTTNILTF
jgi:hypothetical protein